MSNQLKAKITKPVYMLDIGWYRAAVTEKIRELLKKPLNLYWVGEVNAHPPLMCFTLRELTTATVIHLNKGTSGASNEDALKIVARSEKFLKDKFGFELKMLLKDALGSFADDDRFTLPLSHLVGFCTASLLPDLTIDRRSDGTALFFDEFWKVARSAISRRFNDVLTANETIRETGNRKGVIDFEAYNVESRKEIVKALCNVIPKERGTMRNATQELVQGIFDFAWLMNKADPQDKAEIIDIITTILGFIDSPAHQVMFDKKRGQEAFEKIVQSFRNYRIMLATENFSMFHAFIFCNYEEATTKPDKINWSKFMAKRLIEGKR